MWYPDRCSPDTCSPSSCSRDLQWVDLLKDCSFPAGISKLRPSNALWYCKRQTIRTRKVQDFGLHSQAPFSDWKNLYQSVLLLDKLYHMNVMLYDQSRTKPKAGQNAICHKIDAKCHNSYKTNAMCHRKVTKLTLNVMKTNLHLYNQMGEQPENKF